MITARLLLLVLVLLMISALISFFSAIWWGDKKILFMRSSHLFFAVGVLLSLSFISIYLNYSTLL